MKKASLVRVVDEDQSVRNGLEYLLLSKGYEVALFKSAPDFLTKDTPSTLGSLILDIQMPNMSGLEFHNILIELQYKHPIIFHSGHGDSDIAVGAIKAEIPVVKRNSRGLARNYRACRLLTCSNKQTVAAIATFKLSTS